MVDNIVSVTFLFFFFQNSCREDHFWIPNSKLRFGLKRGQRKKKERQREGKVFGLSFDDLP